MTQETPAGQTQNEAVAGAPPASEGNGAAADGIEGSATDRADKERPSRRQRLEEEGDLAADYLEELLEIARLDGDIDMDVENDRATVSIDVEDPERESLRRLVGEDGQVLEALQDLVRLAVAAETGERSRLMLDIAGYRSKRRAQLVELANRSLKQVQDAGAPIRLDPMSPFERKVIHDVVAEAGLRSESEGEGAGRHVVILPSA